MMLRVIEISLIQSSIYFHRGSELQDEAERIKLFIETFFKLNLFLILWKFIRFMTHSVIFMIC